MKAALEPLLPGSPRETALSEQLAGHIEQSGARIELVRSSLATRLAHDPAARSYPSLRKVRTKVPGRFRDQG